jgi:integral membrane sensor domain MASE1
MATMNAPHKRMSFVLVLRFLNIVGAAESALSVGVGMMLWGPNDIFSGAGAPFSSWPIF